METYYPTWVVCNRRQIAQIMSLFFERNYPLIAAIAVAGACFYFNARFPIDGKEFLSAAISVGAIFAGFLATAKAILMALPSDSVMGKLRNSGYIEELIRYLLEALYGSLLFCAVSLMGFFLLHTMTNEPLTISSRLYIDAWFALAIYVGLSFIRIANIMVKVLRSPG